MGAYATALPGGLDDRRRQRGAPRRAVRLPGRRPARASPPRRWSRPAAAARSTCCSRPAATSSRCCPNPTWSTPRSRACRCACTRTSSCRARCSSTGEVVVLLPAATRYEQRGGGTETTTERRIAFSPEIPGPAVGEARSEWEIFVDLARRVAPERAEHVLASRRARRSATRSPSVVPVYAGIELLRDDRRRGPVGRHAPVRRRRCSRRPTAGRTSSPVAPVGGRRPGRAASCSAPGGASSSTRWCTRRRTRSPARMRDALFMAAPTPTALGLATATAVLVRSEHGEMRGAGARRARSARQRAGVLPRGQRAAARRAARPASGVPDYNAVVDRRGRVPR